METGPETRRPVRRGNSEIPGEMLMVGNSGSSRGDERQLVARYILKAEPIIF